MSSDRIGSTCHIWSALNRNALIVDSNAKLLLSKAKLVAVGLVAVFPTRLSSDPDGFVTAG
jgi:hypothetical protein